MIKKIAFKHLVLSFLSVGAVTFGMSQNHFRQTTDIFPKPESGYKKMVIDLPHSGNDDNKKIEFVVGKMIEVDNCNKFGLVGTLQKHDLKGWGFSYYTFNTKGDVFSTKMGCPGQEKQKRFVSSQPELVPYNGKLPLVIYVPADYDVQFKIYTTDRETYFAAEEKEKNK